MPFLVHILDGPATLSYDKDGKETYDVPRLSFALRPDERPPVSLAGALAILAGDRFKYPFLNAIVSKPRPGLDPERKLAAIVREAILNPAAVAWLKDRGAVESQAGQPIQAPKGTTDVKTP